MIRGGSTLRLEAAAIGGGWYTSLDPFDSGSCCPPRPPHTPCSCSQQTHTQTHTQITLEWAAHFHFLHVVSIDYCFCDHIHALGYQKYLYCMLGDSLSNFYSNWLLMMNLSSNNIRLHNSISFFLHWSFPKDRLLVCLQLVWHGSPLKPSSGVPTIRLPRAARAQTIIFSVSSEIDRVWNTNWKGKMVNT
jgi:hypothetical protein